MHISFDPSNPDERKIIRTVLAGFDDDAPGVSGGATNFGLSSAQARQMMKAVLAHDERLEGGTPAEVRGDFTGIPQRPDAQTITGPVDIYADTRNPAEVFAPLAVAPSTAVATALPSAPVGLPVGGVQGATAPLPLAPVAPATVAPLATAQTASPASGVEVDKNGLPWDARIHSSSKSKTQQGVWTRRRGLNDDTMVARVEAELRQLMALPAGAAPATLPIAPVIPAPVLPPVAASMPVAPLQPAGQPAPTTLDQLLPLCTAAETAGTMPKGALVAACQAHQLSSPVALAARADYVPVIYAYLKQQYPGFGG